MSKKPMIFGVTKVKILFCSQLVVNLLYLNITSTGNCLVIPIARHKAMLLMDKYVLYSYLSMVNCSQQADQQYIEFHKIHLKPGTLWIGILLKSSLLLMIMAYNVLLSGLCLWWEVIYDCWFSLYHLMILYCFKGIGNLGL